MGFLFLLRENPNFSSRAGNLTRDFRRARAHRFRLDVCHFQIASSFNMPSPTPHLTHIVSHFHTSQTHCPHISMNSASGRVLKSPSFFSSLQRDLRRVRFDAGMHLCCLCFLKYTYAQNTCFMNSYCNISKGYIRNL